MYTSFTFNTYVFWTGIGEEKIHNYTLYRNRISYVYIRHTWYDNNITCVIQECTDPCCNATSCQLAEGAQCRSGLCCDSTTCQYIDYSTTCRDITEYCSGESSECPQDMALQDAAPCGQDQGFCFSAQCRTYNQQCQQFFGKIRIMATELLSL